MEQEYLEIQKDNKAFHEEVVKKKNVFFSRDVKPEFQNIKGYCAVFLYDKQDRQTGITLSPLYKKNASSCNVNIPKAWSMAFILNKKVN